MILLAAGCFTASAQQDTKEVFNPHWYVQAQGGFQETLGEVSTGDLFSGNAQIAAGYKFTSVWGTRLTVGAWQSKGGLNVNNIDYNYKWNYVAPTLNVTFDLINAIAGYKPRVVNLGVFAGLGANIGWNNDEAANVRQAVVANYPDLNPSDVEFMQYLWKGTKARLVGQFGVNLDFNVSRRVAIGLEANANVTSDRYNSKKAHNSDWYFNTLAGVKIALGKTSKKVKVEPVAPTIIERERVVEKLKHDTIYIKEEAKREALRREVFYTIRVSDVNKSEMSKVEDVVAYLNKYPEAKVTVTGYADKGTGNTRVNANYARKRAQKVADILKNKGISASRIIVDSKGDTVQPFAQNNKNRVTICVAE